MNLIDVNPKPSMFKRATNTVLLYFARRELVRQLDIIKSLKQINKDQSDKLFHLQKRYGVYGVRLEALNAMGVCWLENDTYFVDFPRVLQNLSDEDLDDVQEALVDVRQSRKPRTKRVA